MLPTTDVRTVYLEVIARYDWPLRSVGRGDLVGRATRFEFLARVTLDAVDVGQLDQMEKQKNVAAPKC